MSLFDRDYTKDHPFDRRLSERRANHHAKLPAWIYVSIVLVVVIGLVVNIAQAAINS